MQKETVGEQQDSGRKRLQLSPDEFRDLLQHKVQQYGSQKAFAQSCGINAAWLSEILRGLKDPGPKLLEAVGFRRIVIYEQIEE